MQRVAKSVKLAKLLATIRGFEVDPAPNLQFARRFLYYDVLQNELELATSWPREVCEISEAVV